MKVKDLMVGDWVCVYSNDRTEIHPFRVNEIVERGVYDSHKGFVEEKDIEPIPLTPEILEKNGFEKNEKGLYRISGNIVFNIHSYRLDMYNYDSEYLPYIKICDCKYAHELQHVLKLCGIEKKIVL